MSPVIDVHTHCLTEAWFQLLQQHGAPRYTVEQVRGGLRAIHLDGAPFMTRFLRCSTTLCAWLQ
jgi:aminocarboxymuconate-semialdehyde decarboxylase